jgi:imidazolonepropionase-like amidohydrolase
MKKAGAVVAPFLLILNITAGYAQEAAKLSAVVRKFVEVDAPVVALVHVRVIDGTGSAPMADQTLVIERGTIRAVGSAATTGVPGGAKVLELAGYTVIPGLVGMHDHMFYPAGGRDGIFIYNEQGFSAPRLYLAGGVTTLRTTGSIEPYSDLRLKQLIDEGQLVGPKIHVTGPYLEGAGAFTPQMHELSGPEDARRTVEYWAEQGATSFKAYMHITRAELAAAIQAAHERKLKVTGHLCSIGFREAAALGIDDLEHGLVVDTEFVPGKSSDTCPSANESSAALARLDLTSPPVQAMIQDLVAHHVAVTSTLAVFETLISNRPPLSERVLDAMAPEARLDYLERRTQVAERNDPAPAVLFRKEMEFERAFAKAGGLLLAGNDPTGYGGVLAGFGDQREIELLVEAGFSPVEAIQVASLNGAKYLGKDGSIGSIVPGKQADLVVIHGDPSNKISDIENAFWVFKDGVGYNSAKLIESVRSSVGMR